MKLGEVVSFFVSCISCSMVDYCYPFSVTSRAFPPPLLTILILLLLFQGLVGAPACGDVMKVREIILYSFWVVPYVCLLPLLISQLPYCMFHFATHLQLQIKVDKDGNIQESKFKTFGCGSAIASSSVATEWVKGKHVDEVLSIKNTDIAAHLKLPPVKLHCSMLAEDAIRAAVNDWKAKRDAKKEQVA